MMLQSSVRRALADWVHAPGVYASVDGQYGSTGKGLINSVLAEMFWSRFDFVVTNQGPNSGHTSYGSKDEKIVLKQLPTFGVMASHWSTQFEHARYTKLPDIVLSGGAIINPAVLLDEIHKILINNEIKILIHPCCAVINDMRLREDTVNVAKIASTGQGIGPAIQAKLERHELNVVGHRDFNDMCIITTAMPQQTHQNFHTFLEVAQGYSLGINSRFYPHVTARECTVAQGMADAGISPKHFRSCVMSVRTYPIRVGNTDNSSGGCYPDQKEIQWSDLGVEPETTTVTGRIRRVFTWSKQQFIEAVTANTPDVIFLNFVNYLDPRAVDDFVQQNIVTPYTMVMNKKPIVLLGYGPKNEDVHAL